MTIDATGGGEIRSSCSNSEIEGGATISLVGGSLLLKNGTVLNSLSNGRAIENLRKGNMTVAGGLVKGTFAIYNKRSGNIYVSGGTIEGTHGIGIHNDFGTGNVEISGGTVKNIGNGPAIVNVSSSGKVIISNKAMITSACLPNSPVGGTITLYETPFTDYGLILEGGTIENTADNGIAIDSHVVKISAKVATTIVKGKGIAIRTANDNQLLLDEILQVKGSKNYVDGNDATLVDLETLSTQAIWDYKYLKFEKSYDIAAASINGTDYYFTLQDAIDAVGNNDTIELKNDISENITINNDYSFSINLNGKTWNGTSGSAILHRGNGTVNLTNSEGSANGKVTSCSDGGTITLVGGSLVVSDVKVESTGSFGHAIVNDGSGSIAITDDSLVTSPFAAICNNSTGGISVEDGTVESTTSDATIYNYTTGSINITGGTIKNTKGGVAIHNNDFGQIHIGGNAVITSANNNSTEGTIYLAGGSTLITVLTITGGTVENVAEGGTAIYDTGGRIWIYGGVAIIRGKGMAMNTTPYLGTYPEEWVSASTNYDGNPKAVFSTYANITKYKYLYIDRRLAAEIGDQRYYQLQDAVNAVKDGQTIHLLRENSEKIIINKGDRRSFTIDLNGNSWECVWLTPIEHYGSGTLTITDTASEGKVSGYQYDTIWVEEGNLIVNAGTVLNRGDKKYAIVNNGTGNISIIGGTVEAARGTAIYNQGNGSVSITGGTVRAAAGSAIYNNNKGTITIGGNAMITSANPSPTSGTIYQNDFFKPKAKIEITNGTIENTSESGYAIYSNKNTDITIPDGFPIIRGKGAAMNKAPNLSSYIRHYVTASEKYDGSSPVAIYKADDIAKYKYLKIYNNDVAQIGQIRYSTLQAAVNAVQEYETI